MRAIIIQDTDARALLDRLELRARQLDPSMVLTGANGPEHGKSVGDIHRMLHFEVTRWLQEMGCDVVRR